MTTLIGICSDDKKEVVLAADRQASRMDSDGRTEYKHPTQKLYVNKDRNSAFGIVGAYDGRTQELVKLMIEGKIDLQKVIAEGRFQELLDINFDRFGGKLPDNEKCTGILLATNIDYPRLFTCFPMGKVEQREDTNAGSGSRYVEEYLRAEQVINQARQKASLLNGPISSTVAREMAYRAVRYAAKFDPYSSGLDMVIVSPQSITELGKNITGLEEKAQKQILDLIKRQL